MWKRRGVGRSNIAHDPVSLAGRSFSSKMEAALFQELTLRERAGELENLRCQVSVLLTKAEIKYIADFAYQNKTTGETEYAEAKGFEDPKWRIKRRLWQHYGPGPLHIYKGSAKRLILHETLIPDLS